MSNTLTTSLFQKFFNTEKVGSTLLFTGLITSLIIANSAAAPAFNDLLACKIGFSSPHLNYSISVWINDGLMALFFLLVGLEIKRELLKGELSDFKKATLPVFAACGGMIVPAVIYALFNAGTSVSGGWGIPMATDIAFALAVISLLSKKVPAIWIPPNLRSYALRYCRVYPVIFF